MRVLFLNSCVSGGGAGRSLDMYLRHKHPDIEPFIVVPEKGIMGENFEKFANVIVIPEFVERIHRSPYQLPRFLNHRAVHMVINWWVIPKAMRKIVALCKQLNPDVIYCNHMLAKPVGAYVGWRLNIPVIFHARNISETSFGKWFYTTLAKFRCVKKVLSNSHATAYDFNQQVPQKVKVVHNFIDLDLFNPNNIQKTFRQDYRLPPEAILAGYSGRLVGKKGVDVLLHAFANIYTKCPSLFLVIMGGNDSGDKDYLEEYKALAQNLNISDRVIFTGFVRDIRPYLSDMNMMVLPSIQPEPFGRVLIEAMAYKIPNIATNHGGAIEVITHDVQGILVPPGDPDALAQALEKLALHPDYCRKLGENGYERLISEFSPKVLADNISEAILKAPSISLGRSR